MSNATHTFRAMGTSVSLIGPPSPAFAAASNAVEHAFFREELRFSRFRGESELTEVNGAAGRWTAVSPGFAALLQVALRQAAATNGLFDPSVLDAVNAAGYDRDFDEVLAGARGALHPPRPCGRWREVRTRPGAVLLPEHVGLDFGGIAKGWTVDIAAEAAIEAGLSWALVNAGGDLRLAGDAPVAGVMIEDPFDAASELLRIQVPEGAIATSSVTKRAWGAGLHHLIDPRTGSPSAGEVIQATVWAPTCAEAEVRAKWALLTGRAAAEQLPSILVLDTDEVLLSFDVGKEAA